MGFRLSSFLGGVATGLNDKIQQDEERTQLAMVGRIKSASEKIAARKKEMSALEEQLVSTKRDMESNGVTDPDVQKAFLSNVESWTTYKDLKMKGTPGTEDPLNFFSINKDKLFAGTPDEFVKTVLAKKGDSVAPKFEAGKGALGLSSDYQSKMFAGLAGAQGLTPEDITAAENDQSASMPDVAISMKPDALIKPTSLTDQIENTRTALASATDEDRSQIETKLTALMDAQNFGKDEDIKSMVGKISAQLAKDPNNKQLQQQLTTYNKIIAKNAEAQRAASEIAAAKGEKNLTYPQVRSAVNNTVKTALMNKFGREFLVKNKMLQTVPDGLGGQIEVLLPAQPNDDPAVNKVRTDAAVSYLNELGHLNPDGSPKTLYGRSILVEEGMPLNTPAVTAKPSDKTVTRSEIEAIAAKNNVPVDEVIKSATAEGYTIK